MKALSSNSAPKQRQVLALKKRLLPLLLFSIFYFPFSPQAEARVYIQIDQASEKKFPIAVADLASKGESESKEWKTRVSETIRKDLAMTGVFDLIAESQFPDGERAPNPSITSFQPWSLIGAQALVVGSYVKSKDGAKIDMYLLDPVVGQTILTRSYTGKSDEPSVVAHHFADEIMRELTGEEGVFSTKIAYVQAGKKVKEIAVMDMNGENSKTITHEKSTALSPAFSPDGSRIAFTTFGKSQSYDIAVIGSSGGSVKRMTNGGVNLSPTWSPSGGLTAASIVGGGDTEIVSIGAGGGIGKKLAPSAGIDVNPSWAPDGSAFVFASERAGKLHLFRADAGGGNVQRLTFVGSQNDNPAWSPKGDKIVFQSLSGGWDLFLMNADGSMIQRLTSTGNCESPSWAPNGRFITASCGGRVVVMREDGSNLTTVGPGGSLQPSWGPQSK